MKSVKDIVLSNLYEYIKNLGYELVDVEFCKKYNGDNLTIIIDKPGGINIDDCETVHRSIDTKLDEINPTDDKPYILNVSSCGLDRPLKTTRDFERNINKVIEIKLFAPQDGKKEFSGKLISVDGNIINIIENNTTINFQIDKIANCKLKIEIN